MVHNLCEFGFVKVSILLDLRRFTICVGLHPWRFVFAKVCNLCRFGSVMVHNLCEFGSVKVCRPYLKRFAICVGLDLWRFGFAMVHNRCRFGSVWVWICEGSQSVKVLNLCEFGSSMKVHNLCRFGSVWVWICEGSQFVKVHILCGFGSMKVWILCQFDIYVWSLIDLPSCEFGHRTDSSNSAPGFYSVGHVTKPSINKLRCANNSPISLLTS